MCIKLVNGNEMDSLFDEVERIKELYIYIYMLGVRRVQCVKNC